MSKWSKYDNVILSIYRNSPSKGWSAAAREILGEDADYKDIDLLRTYIKRFIEKQEDVVYNTSETNATPDYMEEVVSTDAFKKYCEEEGIDISRVKSAKFVNHAGQQKFNVVLDYSTSFEFDWDEFSSVMMNGVESKDIPKAPAESKKALHLYHSDMHIGSWVSENSIYENEYSLEEVRRRLQVVRALAMKKVGEHGVFDTLALFDLGDMLDGYNSQTTRGGHHLPQNMTNIQQFEAAITVYKQHIASLVNSKIAENYVFHATCNDNHSGDFSYFALRALAEWCSFAYPEVDVQIQTKFIDTYKYGSHTFLVTHGKDKEFMKHGMPKYLDKKTEIFIKDYIDQMDVTGNIHFIKGDLHQDCVDFCNRFRYRNTLSLFGASEWIHTNFGYSRAGLSYDIVDKDSKDVNEGRIFF